MCFTGVGSLRSHNVKLHVATWRQVFEKLRCRMLPHLLRQYVSLVLLNEVSKAIYTLKLIISLLNRFHSHLDIDNRTVPILGAKTEV